ncbi:hypothetical protein BU23DRAFT_553536 [Bimuria novae-zelandiae CBS 107.79]|uniref:Uncharacterized protein n=1 Tax=Bimuria novae-zelandiae CBS 107.79 TaxID=1447943 RepID=A0A6A5VAG6_9PLEO|nr:hypothetical protein BU23DRAFT_553536 [Bimuria novae-zelandiae CBS 107.79]
MSHFPSQVPKDTTSTPPPSPPSPQSTPKLYIGVQRFSQTPHKFPLGGAMIWDTSFNPAGILPRDWRITHATGYVNNVERLALQKLGIAHYASFTLSKERRVEWMCMGRNRGEVGALFGKMVEGWKGRYGGWKEEGERRAFRR